MATDVPMPKLGLTMEEATIIEWLVAEGDTVDTDQPILRIETDKTETEVGSPAAGRLHIIGKPGDVFACGVRIGVLLGEGEQAPAAAAPATTAAPAAKAATAPVARTASAAPRAAAPAGPVNTGRIVATPYAKSLAAERGVQLAYVRGTGPNGRIVAADVLETPAGVPAVGGPAIGAPTYDYERAFAVATSAARTLADLLGVDLAEVPLDAIEQRITRDTVAWYVRQQLARLATPSSTPAAASSVAATAAAPSYMPLTQEPTQTQRMSGMRSTIAKRMHQSLQEMAQLTLSMDADMSGVLADRAERKRAGGAAPSITDYVVAASARALVRHPGMNAQLTEQGIALLPEVHVGLAVAVPNGLLVPVVRDAAHRDLADLSAETTRVATGARAGSLAPADYEGGTFSVSALGAFGVDMFTPVINPPNVGILGVGRLRDELVLVNGEVKAAPRLTLSLTWDHRVLDGVPAAEFCRTVCELLADPSQLG